MKGRTTPIHHSITADRVCTLVEADANTGICLTCGADQDGTEPDAKGYECRACGAFDVQGAEVLLLRYLP